MQGKRAGCSTTKQQSEQQQLRFQQQRQQQKRKASIRAHLLHVVDAEVEAAQAAEVARILCAPHAPPEEYGQEVDVVVLDVKIGELPEADQAWRQAR